MKIKKAIEQFERWEKSGWIQGEVPNTYMLILAKKALEKQLNGSWIPASERLPTIRECQENDCRFIVTDGNRVYQSLFSIYDGKQFVDITYKGNCNFITTIDKCVTAWQNLPEQYKEKNNE